jgi:hypothetical protein
MVNYNKSTIYKLCCKDTEITDEYVGSTTNFNRRKAEHKSHCHNENGSAYHFKVYECIRDNGGWGNWDMVEIEKYCASDKNDLHKRERFWVETLKSSLNKQIPSRTLQEYRSEHKETTREYDKKYYETNQDKIKDTHKKYYEDNKENIQEYASTKVVCECGSEITRSCLSRHKRSAKHIKSLNQ